MRFTEMGTTGNPTEELQGKKVYIRPPHYEELSFIRMLWADQETMEPVGGPHYMTDEEAGEWFKRMVFPGDGTNFYCLIFTQKNIPVGEISFHRWYQLERSAELNIKVQAGYRGNGYASDALGVFLDWFFGQVGGSLMRDNVAWSNTAGQKLLESLGFERNTDISDTCMLFMTREMHQALSMNTSS